MPTSGSPLARRCTECGIQYPPSVKVCLVCKGRTWPLYKSGPDIDWEDTVKASLATADPDADIAYTTPHKADVSIPLHVRSALMWLPHASLLEAGYLNLEAGSVVYVNNRFYELQGRQKREGDMWWIKELVVDGAFDDITPEDIINGGDDG